MKCSGCQREGKQSGNRLPRSWKRREPEAFCPDCWGTRYLLRAITFPIVTPIDCTWEELRNDLRAMWRETTRCSNWMMTECYARDVRRTGDVGEKMPPMPKVYLYPDARKLFPSLPPQTVCSIEQAVQRKYRKLRYRIVWTGDVSLPTSRYPAPFPVHNQSWQSELCQERPHVRFRIGDGWRTVRLKGGAQMHRQRKAFDSIVSGTAKQGELAIYRKGTDLLVKMVAWLPRSEKRAHELSGDLVVRTGKSHLLAAINGKDEAIWTYNGDYLPRWIVGHAKRLQRWADDQKFENRPIPSFRSVRDEAVEKYHDRMDSAAHEIAHQLVGYAERRGFARIVYDDSERSFCPGFIWAKLRSLITEKADASTIAVQFASSEPASETPEALAEE